MADAPAMTVPPLSPLTGDELRGTTDAALAVVPGARVVSCARREPEK